MIPRHQTPTGLSYLLFGAPYYPEHWPEEVRKTDGARMVEAAVNTVRMAEFAWDLMEPEPGRYDFSLFEDVSNELGDLGIKTLMCTPTATPPRWLTHGKDHWLRVDVDGKPMQHGNRQHICTNQPEFRAESRRITRAMAEHFKDHPHVIGWQTDNELYCHISFCYCEACQQGFRDWLQAKYKAIEELNRCWGNAFWAQTYTSFDQIELPRSPKRPAYVNPSQTLDHLRFLSDGICSFQREQVEILKEVNPAWKVFHNGTFGPMDYWEFAGDLDFFAVDVYQGFCVGESGTGWEWGAYKNDQCRSVSGGFIVPEQNGGGGGQFDYMNPTPGPGQMRLWAYQALAHGADGVLHFRWRTCSYGAEMYWNGILDQDNVPRRRFEEFAQEGREFAVLSDAVCNSLKQFSIGILNDYEQDSAFATQHNGFPPPKEQIEQVFAELARRQLPFGLLDTRDSFEGMEVLILPSYLPGTQELADKLEAFVASGGTLLVSGRTFTRDVNNHVITDTAPGALRKLQGVTREEEGRLHEGHGLCVLTEAGTFPVSGGYEFLGAEMAEVLGVWSRPGGEGVAHVCEGKPVIACNSFGEGKAISFGGYLVDGAVAPMMDLLLEQHPVAPLVEASPMVEATLRTRQDHSLLFVLNHDAHSQSAIFEGNGTDLLTGEPVSGSLNLDPRGVAVIQLQER